MDRFSISYGTDAESPDGIEPAYSVSAGDEAAPVRPSIEPADAVRSPRYLSLVVGLIIALMVGSIAFLTFSDSLRPSRTLTPAVAAHLADMVNRKIAPADAVPEVEAVEIEQIDAKTAAEINAAMPITTAANPAAKPFMLDAKGDAAANFDRAADCLTSAIYYEAAGQGRDGEAAVAQVILNRVRHPAFPKTVCGVVFQGSHLPTGCQFSYTCDGSLARTPSASGWAEARSIAKAALSGHVFEPVGYATHYHADYVVPKWRTELDKLAVIKVHIFYRWAGWWGTPPAFRGGYTVPEPVIEKLAVLSPAHAAVDTSGVLPPSLLPTLKALQADVGARGTDEGPTPLQQFRIVLTGTPEGYLQAARVKCQGIKRCSLSGWTSAPAVPMGAAMTPQQDDARSFAYFKDDGARIERVQWNCREFRDRDMRTCLKTPLLVDLHQSRITAPTLRMIEPARINSAAK